MWLLRTHPFISPYVYFRHFENNTYLIRLTEIFRFPYEIFVDASPGQMLYRALGMGHVPTGAQKARSSIDHAAGTYVRHGTVSGLAMVVANALRVGMPVWARGGDASQLGGEFVLGPGYVYFFILVACDVLICGHRQIDLYVRTPNAEHRWPCTDRRRSRGSGSAFHTEGSRSRTGSSQRREHCWASKAEYQSSVGAWG